MNPKLAKLFEKLPWMKKVKWGRGASVFRWALFVVVGFVVTSVAGVAGWFAYHPLESYRPQIEAYLKRAAHAEELSFQKIRWNFAPASLAIGVRMEALRVRDSTFAKELEAPNVDVLVEPLMLLTGKLPLKLRIVDGIWVARGAAAGAGEAKRADSVLSDVQSSPRAAGWAKRMRIKLHLENTQLSVPASVFGLSAADSLIKAYDTEIETSIVGFPGQFSGSVKGEIDVILGGKSFRAKGPVKLRFDGYSQVVDGKPVGLFFEQMDSDLDELYVMSGDFFQKIPAMRLSLRSEAQTILDDNFDWDSFEIQKGLLELDELSLNFSATYNAQQKSAAVRWTNSPQEVKSFRFPLRGLTDVPVKGIIEAQGNVKTSAEGGLEAGWKVSFNNLKVDPKRIKHVFDATSKGEMTISFVSEGSFAKGLVSTPRTELQVNASGTHLEMGGGKFIKPLGDPINLLMKATVQDDELNVSRIEANLNNLALLGTLKLGSLMKYLREEGPGQLAVNAQTNAVDLTKWSAYVPVFRQIPLEGLVQVAGTADGPIHPGELPYRELGWRVDRINASKVKGSFDRDSFIRMGYKTDELSLSGPFNVEFLFQGRGKGTVVERGTLLAQADFTKVFISAGERFRKIAGIPLSLDLSAEQISNRFSVRRGQLRIHKLDLGFSGNILQGSQRNSIDVRFGRPLDLQEWRDLLPRIPPEYPFAGRIDLAARMGFDRAGVMEGNLDWRKLSLDGEISVDGLGMKLPNLKNALTQGKGKVVVNGNSLAVPGFAFKLGPAQFNLSARGTTLSKLSPLKASRAASAAGNLGLLFGRDPWDLSATLDVDELSPRVFELDKRRAANSTDDNSPELASIVRWAVNSEKIFASKLKLVLQSKQSSGQRFRSDHLKGIFNWEKGALRADPLVLKVFGGEVSGSLGYDLKPMVLRKDPPTMNLAFKFRNADARSLIEYLQPDFSAVFDAKLSGSLNFAAEGADLEALRGTARGRISGTFAKAAWTSLQPLNREIDAFFNQPDARDHLVNRGNRGQCFRDPANGRFDAQWAGGTLEVQESELAYAGGSFVKVVGDVDGKGKTRFSGEFLPSSSCLGNEVRACLENKETHALSFPFSLTGTLEAPQIKSQMAERAAEFATCAVTLNTRKSRTAMESGRGQRADEAARKRIRALIKEN